ncbi:hypothetical protein K491DRAFT_215950 [Lophiostoma macrostomum CBS 122681]|uniref:Uncharacterized protein n=1 Tax=Lophiostoma macrostomum CBS 122681 TaxID=1314788 RepID=A0A6A6TIF1_9PLEO|nr:hypothetical protein K491DRAFT_215950 [Lophiostoma macrostomum CBS 122681]
MSSASEEDVDALTVESGHSAAASMADQRGDTSEQLPAINHQPSKFQSNPLPPALASDASNLTPEPTKRCVASEYLNNIARTSQTPLRPERLPGRIREDVISHFSPSAAKDPGRMAKEDIPYITYGAESRTNDEAGGIARGVSSQHNIEPQEEVEPDELLSWPAANVSHVSRPDSLTQSDAETEATGRRLSSSAKHQTSKRSSPEQPPPSMPSGFGLDTRDDLLDPGTSAFEYAIRPYTDTSTSQYLLGFLSPTHDYSSSDEAGITSTTPFKALSTGPLAPPSTSPGLELPSYLRGSTLTAQIQLNTVRVALLRCSIIARSRAKYHEHREDADHLKRFLNLGKVAASVIPIAERLGHHDHLKLCWYWRGRASAAMRDWDAAEKALEQAEELDDANDDDIEPGLNVSHLLGQVRAQKELATQRDGKRVREMLEDQTNLENDSKIGAYKEDFEMRYSWSLPTRLVWEPSRR